MPWAARIGRAAYCEARPSSNVRDTIVGGTASTGEAPPPNAGRIAKSTAQAPTSARRCRRNAISGLQVRGFRGYSTVKQMVVGDTWDDLPRFDAARELAWRWRTLSRLDRGRGRRRAPC